MPAPSPASMRAGRSCSRRCGAVTWDMRRRSAYLATSMTDDATETEKRAEPGFAALRRFLPYLWPEGEPRLKARVVLSLLLVVGLDPGHHPGDAARLRRRDQPDDRGHGAAVGDRDRAGRRLCRRALRRRAVRQSAQRASSSGSARTPTRRLAETIFRHLHDLSLRFHLERRTGAVTKIVERGTKSIDTMLYFLLFNIAPTVLQLAIVLHHLLGEVRARPGRRDGGDGRALYPLHAAWSPTGGPSCGVEMNDLDTGAVARAVDSACSITRRSNISAPRSARRRATAAPSRRYADAAVKNETSPRLAQHRPVADHQCDDGGRDGLRRLGLEQGPVHHRRRGGGQHPARPALPPARPARHGLSHDPPGPDRHGRDVRPDRHARRSGRRARRARPRSSPPAMSASRTCISATSPSARY